MPQELKQSSINSFVRGLITEASPLTFPDNASVDELNCDLERTGVRKRRKGIEYETDNQLSTFTVPAGTLVHTKTWENVSNLSGVEFLVVQAGDTLRFYDKSSSPISAAIKSFTVDLNDFSAGNGEPVESNKIDASSIDGVLVVVSPAISPFFIEYDTDTDTITTEEIVPRVRDFEWQGDTSEYYEEEPKSTASEERKYDTYNSGWVDRTGDESEREVLIQWVDSEDSFPPLTHPWFSGIKTDVSDAIQKFGPEVWKSTFGGTSLSGNGHFILDLFKKDRKQAVIDDEQMGTFSVDLPAETESSRFSTVTKYAGRIWYAGLKSAKNGSKVFFSPVVQGTDDLGKCFQEADPTSQQAPDLVDSDGGSITITPATNITALFEWGNSLLVFAENGVWEISGPEGIFKATEYFVSRVRNADGLFNTSSLVNAEGNPIWWGNTGIFSVSKEDSLGRAEGIDVSKDTIQTFWENIGADFRSRAIGEYDELNKRVFWLYGDDATEDYKFNRVLILDILLRAFVPWRIEDEASNTNFVVGMSYFSGLGAVEEQKDVVSNSGTDDVILNGGVDDVVASVITQFVEGPTEIRFLVKDGSTNKLTFATFSNSDFKDWGSVDFSSYAEASYDFDDDLSTRKNNVYVTCYFNLTETGFTGDETNGYDFLNPSSCFLKSFWDLRNGASSSQQVYRHLRPINVDSGDLTSFNYPYDSIVTRNKIRGRGRVLKLRFESEAGKDFQLQGYEVINAKNTRV